MKKWIVGLGVFGLALMGQALAQAGFFDVSLTHPNRAAIFYVQQEGIVQGYPDGSFRPNIPINRVEFMKIVLEATLDRGLIDGCIGANTDESWEYVFFPDVRKADWFAPYVCAGKVQGIVQGYPDGEFKPGNDISFVEAAKIIVNANDIAVPTDDVWFRPFVEALETRGAIPTQVQSFGHLITRAQMAEMTHRLRERITNLPTLSYAQLERVEKGESAVATYDDGDDGDDRGDEGDEGDEVVFEPEIPDSGVSTEAGRTIGVMADYTGTFDDGYSGITGTTYYVSTKGSNSNAGTKEKPWRTPGFGSRQLSAGDALVIMGGKYDISIFDEDIMIPISGTAENWITIKGEEGNRPVLAGSNNLLTAIDVSGKHYVRIENLEITSDNGANFRDGIEALGAPASHITLKDLHIHHLDEFGVNMGDISHLHVVNSDISYTGFGSIGGPAGSAGGMQNVVILNSNLSNNGRYYAGTISENRENLISPYDRPDGFGNEASEGPITIGYSLVENNFGDGIDIKSANAYVHNTIVRNNYGDGVKLWRGDSKVENVLIYGRGGGINDPSPWAAIVLEGLEGETIELINITVDEFVGGNYTAYVQYDKPEVPMNIVIRNSIFSSTGDRAHLFFANSVNLTMENNLFYVPNSDVTVEHNGKYYVPDPGSGELSLNQLGPHNTFADPLFVRPGDGTNEGDYHLQEGSPAIDRGDGRNVLPEDLDGVSRPQNRKYDIGAYEQ